MDMVKGRVDSFSPTITSSFISNGVDISPGCNRATAQSQNGQRGER